MKILAYPYDASNPYQTLLYENMKTMGVVSRYLKGPTTSHTFNLLLLPLMCIAYRLSGYDVFHLHWSYTFVLPWAGEPGRWIMQLYFYVFIVFLRVFGYRIVWTAHNTLPHERVFYNDLAARQFLGNISYRVLTHTRSGQEQLVGIDIDEDKVKIVPHGSYSGTYSNQVSRSEARKVLGISPRDRVVLFFGQIRRYKGVEDLLEAYSKILNANKPVLLIAGSVKDEGLSKLITSATQKDKRIHSCLKFIPDDEIQLYFKATDFTILPYTRSTTSAVALLSCTFGRPVVAPNLPIFTTMPASTRIIYTDDGLRDCLSKLNAIASQDIDRMSKESSAYAESLSWDKIAQLTIRAIA